MKGAVYLEAQEGQKMLNPKLLVQILFKKRGRMWQAEAIK
jgi:hypothetical protein